MSDVVRPVGVTHTPVEAEEFVEAAHRRTPIDPDTPAWLLPVARALLRLNRLMVGIGMVAALGAALVLTSSVISRYVMHASTDWQHHPAAS